MPATKSNVTKITKPFNASVQKLRDELEAAEFINEMKEMDVADLQAELVKVQAALKWSQEWGECMYERAWKAEAGLEDCERELCIVKAELYQSHKSFFEVLRARRSLFPANFTNQAGDSDNESGEDSPPRYRTPSGGVNASPFVVEEAENDPISPISPLDLPPAIPWVGRAQPIPGAPFVTKTYSYVNASKEHPGLFEDEPEWPADWPTDVPKVDMATLESKLSEFKKAHKKALPNMNPVDPIVPIPMRSLSSSSA